jgi:ABC-type multidrug transport system ATPase subunit
MTLLLGPPGAGKSTLLLALAGKLDSDLQVKFHYSCLDFLRGRSWVALHLLPD